MTSSSQSPHDLPTTDEPVCAREKRPALAPETMQRAKVRVMGRAGALLHLINFDEPFGLSVSEAMACGTPVIAINRGSMPQLIEDGRTGYLVATTREAAAAVDQIGNLDRASVSHEAGRRFSVSRMAEEYLTLYRRILRKGRREKRALYLAAD